MADFKLFENEAIIEPGGYSKVKFISPGTPFIDVSTMILIGESKGGVPFNATDKTKGERVNVFTDPNDAKEVLRSGDLLEAALIAFDPTNDENLVGARRVMCVRVNQATKSSLLLSGIVAASEIDLFSRDYGKHTLQTSVQVDASASVDFPGLQQSRFTIVKDGDEEDSGNLILPLVKIDYTGVSAAVTISNDTTAGQIEIKDGATSLLILPHDDFDTVGAVVNAIDALVDFEAEVMNNSAFPTNLLDDTYVAAAVAPVPVPAAGTGYLAGSYEQQLQYLDVVSKYVTSDNNTTIRVPMATMPKTFLTGGTETAPVNQDWIDAIAVAEIQEEAFYQIELSGDVGISQLNKASVKFSNRAKQRRERIGGGGEGALWGTVAYASRQANSRSLGSFLYNWCASPLIRTDSKGATVTMAPKFNIVASMVINSGNGPNTASTFKKLNGSGNPEIYEQNDRDAFIKAGCQIINSNPTNGTPRILRSVTTHQGPELIPSEMSMVATALAMAKTFRIQMEEAFVGDNVTSNEQGLIEAEARRIFNEFVELGYLTTDPNKPDKPEFDFRELVFNGDTVFFKIDGIETPVLNFIFAILNLSTIGA